MIISHKYKFIFFSNPKTGSESIRMLLKPYSEVDIKVFKERTNENPFYSHITPKETLAIFHSREWNYALYRKFVFTRNPWERIISIYNMIKRSNSLLPPFNQWIQEIDNKGTGGGGNDSARWRKYGTYSIDNYAGDGNGKILVDKIFRLEDINLILVPYLKRLGLKELPIKIPKLNRSPEHHNYKDWYDNNSIKRMNKLYRFEIENFKYSF